MIQFLIGPLAVDQEDTAGFDDVDHLEALDHIGGVMACD